MLIETVPIPDIYADDMEVENLGSCFRGIYYTYNQTQLGEAARVVVAKIVRPISSTRPDLFAKLQSGLLVPVRPKIERVDTH